MFVPNNYLLWQRLRDFFQSFRRFVDDFIGLSLEVCHYVELGQIRGYPFGCFGNFMGRKSKWIKVNKWDYFHFHPQKKTKKHFCLNKLWTKNSFSRNGLSFVCWEQNTSSVISIESKAIVRCIYIVNIEIAWYVPCLVFWINCFNFTIVGFNLPTTVSICLNIIDAMIIFVFICFYCTVEISITRTISPKK